MHSSIHHFLLTNRGIPQFSWLDLRIAYSSLPFDVQRVQACNAALWIWFMELRIHFCHCINIEMHEFLFEYHLWGGRRGMLGYLIHLWCRLVPHGSYSLFICIWRTFWYFFPLLLLLFYFSSTWHNWWSTVFILFKDFYYSSISQNVSSGDNPFSPVCSLAYRLKVENDKLIWTEARTLAFEFYYLIICPCTNCFVSWENSFSLSTGDTDIWEIGGITRLNDYPKTSWEFANAKDYTKLPNVISVG